MDNNEKKLLKDLSELVDSNMCFEDIANEINYFKYIKEKKNFSILKRITLTVMPLVLVISLVLSIVIILNNGKNQTVIKFPNDPNLINNLYNGFIKTDFEKNINSVPTLSMQGPLPPSPIIDGHFNNLFDESQNPNMKPGDTNLEPINIPQLPSFKYIYEVEYKNMDANFGYVTVYLEKGLANKIYEQNKVVMDAPNASPLDKVNGSIVKWFYSKLYYDKSKVFWCQYVHEDSIYSEIDGYICVGVYIPQQRIINREIFSDISINIVDNIYTGLYFKNEGNKFLTPVNYNANNIVTWYASNNIIDETNTYFLFNITYSSQFDCVIDRENNTIRLMTYAVQDENSLNINYVSSLKNYHIWSNQVIVKNENPNKKFGETSYITYKYEELVRILQALAIK